MLGIDPSADEIRQLLSLVYIQVLDVDEGGDGEREAKDLLRGVVLRNPEQADTAWAQLIALCASFAGGRSGADRLGLQQTLLDAGIELQATRSYRSDIERLKGYSRWLSEALGHHAFIRVGSTRLKIRRRSTDELRRVAESTSILVVAEPGAGKSGALHDFVEAIRSDERDFVFLAADRLAARSLGQLREELNLDHELPEILENWPGTQPAFLVIDALDAVRGGPAEIAILDLIRVVVERNDRWRVVAAIRKFDLRYNTELRKLFSGQPPTEFEDPEPAFKGIRHLSIPRLSLEELAQISSQSADLQTLIENAPNGLYDLLRVPFNLQLMAELLDAGVDTADLTPVRTQLELLDRYWLHRIIRSSGEDDAQQNAREAVLRRICEEMVKARTLRVDRLGIVEPATSAPLNDLLRAHVLVEWQPSPTAEPDRYVLTFSHHILFDYAVARLLLRGRHESLIGRLVDDPDLVVFVRPSLSLHFQHLWSADRDHQRFWDLVLRMMKVDEIPEIGKAVGASVAAQLAKDLSDLEPLCTSLEGPDEAPRRAAEQALRHLVGSLLTVPSGGRPLVGPDAGPWCNLLERLSRDLKTPVAYMVRSLLTTLCEQPDSFTSEQRANAGKAARCLLEFAWSQVPRDRRLVIHALQSVCRTFESDVSASSALLRQCLEPCHLSEYGFEEMPWLALEVKRLIPLDPGLVEDIYRAAFAHQEVSQAPTQLSESRILPLISDRQQDYHMALYELAEVFPEFLADAPRHATRAVIAVLEAYVAHRHGAPSAEVERTFDFGGRLARVRTDYSAIWDDGDAYRNDEPLRMLDAFEQYVKHQAERDERTVELRELVEVLVAENRLAVFWRRLLLLGAQFPETLGREIRPLAWAMPILTSRDTSAPAGKFLKAVFPILPPGERERVERALLSIPDEVGAARREVGEHMRNRLLGCLADADLVTEEAQRLLVDFRAVKPVPPNETSVRVEEFTSSPYSKEECLADEGVQVKAEANQKIRDLQQPVKEFADKHLNSVPTPAEVTAVLPALQALREALFHADADGVHPNERDYAWGHLAAACSRIARVDELSFTEDARRFVKTVLIEASYNAEPIHDPECDAQFDESPSWGSPAARVDAAEGLVAVARHPGCASAEVLQAIERLSTDPVPAVRFQIAGHLTALYHTVPELMWRIIERLCREEKSCGVLAGLLNGTLGRLASAHPDHVAGLTKEVFERVGEAPGASKIREQCTHIFTGLYLLRDHTLCREVILGIAANPDANPEEAACIVQDLREPLTYGPVHPPDPKQDAIRERAFALIACILRSAIRDLRGLEAAHKGVPFRAWLEVDQEKARSLAHLIDSVGREIYFASGAFDEKDRTGTRNRKLLAPEEKKRFYREAGPILDELAGVGLPTVTHHLLKTLEAFIPLDPRGVFLRIGRVIRGGQQGGYQYESLAASLIVNLIERYLAEYRTLLREDEECRRTLLEVLDVFVQAGWPSAQRLTYRLDEIFR
ncbi:MAG: hypothetical protein GX492_10685 [Firmicutes bacterium]|nr:hypothetical protein [Bacillota bacterium]